MKVPRLEFILTKQFRQPAWMSVGNVVDALLCARSMLMSVRRPLLYLFVGVIVVVSAAMIYATMFSSLRPKVSRREMARGDLRRVYTSLVAISEDYDKSFLTLQKLKTLASAPTAEGAFVTDFLKVMQKDNITYHNSGKKISSLKPNNPILSLAVQSASGETVVLSETVGGQIVTSNRIPQDDALLQ